MIELQIFAAMLAQRSVYEQFERIGDAESFSNLGRIFYKALQEYYRLDRDVQRCDRSLLAERVIRSLPNPKHAASFREFIQSIPKDVSVANVSAEITEQRRQHVGAKLGLALANRADGAAIGQLLAEYRSVTDGFAGNTGAEVPELIDVFDTTDLQGEESTEAPRIRLWPKALNDRIGGGVRRGHHIVLFARPEMGKTAFAINLCAGFIKQGLSICYAGNEEPAADIRDRLLARLLKIPRNELRDNRARILATLGGRGAVSLDVASLHPGTPSQIERLLGAKKYDVLVIDQLRNLQVRADTKVGELETAAKAARELGKKNNLVTLSITQAGDSASNKVYLDMNDVDSSKTGIPATADLQIGVGADASMKANGLLGVSLVKNKISGNHDRFTVTCNFSTGVIL